MSVLFGVPHWLKGEGESVIGGLRAGIYGFVMALAFRWTGSLWFAIGAHAGWDWSQSFLFGTPDSAIKLQASLLHPVVTGPGWLSGGAAGPEGSVFAILPVVGFALFAWRLGRKRPPVIAREGPVAAE